MASADEVRELALSLPGAHESHHFDVTDFRVNNKIFCTLPRPGQMGMRIGVDEQAALLAEDPDTFERAKGKWGEQGWTLIRLDAVDQEQLRELIIEAWRTRAPKKLLAEYDSSSA
jgi:hypothetical protein